MPNNVVQTQPSRCYDLALIKGRIMQMTQTLKTKADLHLARKIWHCSGILLIAYLYTQMNRSEALKLLLGFGSLVVVIDILRLKFKGLNEGVIKVLGPVMRAGEKNSISGSSALMIGAFLIIYFFPRDIVTLSLLFLAAADPVASYFGVKYGKDKLIGPKSLQGTTAAFITCTLIAAVFFYSQNLMAERVLIASLLAGFFGAISELISIGKIDDNLSFPVFNSCFLWIIFYIFGGF